MYINIYIYIYICNRSQYIIGRVTIKQIKKQKQKYTNNLTNKVECHKSLHRRVGGKGNL